MAAKGLSSRAPQGGSRDAILKFVAPPTVPTARARDFWGASSWLACPLPVITKSILIPSLLSISIINIISWMDSALAGCEAGRSNILSWIDFALVDCEAGGYDPGAGSSDTAKH